MKSYRLSVQQIANTLGSDINNGLNDNSILESQKKYGLNFVKAKHYSFNRSFVNLYKNVNIIGLIIIALFYAAFSAINKQYSLIITPCVILAIIVIYSITRVFVNGYFEKKFEAACKKAVHKVTVLRNGVRQQIDVKLLLPGDIIFLSAGDIVPADARLIEANSLVVDQQLITKSKVPKEKFTEIIDKDNIALQDMDNMVFANTTVLSGGAKAIVTDTGRYSLYHKLSIKDTSKRVKQSIVTRLTELDRLVQIVLIIILAVYFIISIVLHNDIFYSLLYLFTLTAFCAVTVIPEIIRLIFNNTSLKLAKNGLIVDDFQTIQTLSRIDTLCLDQSLLIQQDSLNLTHCVLSDGLKQLDDADNKKLLQLLMYAALCCNDKNSSLAKAVFLQLDKLGVSEKMLNNRCTLVCQDKNLVFDKYQASVYVMDSNVFALYIGEPYEILNKCKETEFVQLALNQYSQLSDKGYRCIAIAATQLDNIPAEFNAEIIDNLSLVGILAYPAVVSKKTKSYIKELKEAGIRPVIFTDSNPLLAIRIASSLDLFGPKDIVINCDQISGMGYSDLLDATDKAVVVCGCKPKLKQQVLSCMRDKGKSILLITSDTQDKKDAGVCDILCVDQKCDDVLIKNANLISLGSDAFLGCADAIKMSKRSITSALMVSMFMLSVNLGLIILSLLNMVLPTRFFINVIELALINMPLSYLFGILVYILTCRIKTLNKLPSRKFLMAAVCALGIIFSIACVAVCNINGLPFMLACIMVAVLTLLWSLYPRVIKGI